MLKVLAVLRALYLVFIVGYTLRAMPWFFSQATTFDEQYARCSGALNLALRAAWLAVAWIAFETVLGFLGWWFSGRAGRRKSATAAPSPGASVPPAP